MSHDVMLLLSVAVPSHSLKRLRSAAEIAVPAVPWEVREFDNLEDAMVPRAADEQALLVLGSSDAAAIDRAYEALNARGLPRWAVVVAPHDGAALRTGVEGLTADELEEPQWVARVLRANLTQLALRRDWARERGDVWTLGRRLTHDLRNPLGCIVTTAEMLKETMDEEQSEHLPLVVSIVESTAEMLDLMNRVHFVAKASAQPPVPALLDMDGCHQAALDRLARELKRRGVAVQAPEEWPTVRGVRPWLEVIWGNLISNALRHNESSAPIHTGWAREAGGWRFWVADTGPGVPEDRVASLFTPFDRLHTRHGGGLGLSIVQRLVELHGGTCSYERPARGGARFSFVLPATADDAAPASNSVGNATSAAHA